MLLQELFEGKISSRVVCIFPGGFHLWSPGHSAVYNYLKEHFPTADLYVASTNVTSERPFSFPQKRFLASQAGILPASFVQVKEPYKSYEIMKKYNPKSTKLIFGLSSKDAERLGNPIKKDGTKSFIQPYPGNVNKMNFLDKHAYYVIVPAVKFKILGKNITSASVIRQMYYDADDRTRYEIIKDLYPQSKQINKIKTILDKVLFKTEKINESPDFGYSNFRDKDIKLSKVVFKENAHSEGHFIKAYYKKEKIGFIRIIAWKIGVVACIGDAHIIDKWRGTGLGQMLYDKAIQRAKEIGQQYIDSDWHMRPDAHKAWARLSKRYPVQKRKNGGVIRYRIDLSKI